MQLVLDASALLPEALRARGRRLLRSAALELVISEEALSETTYEITRRVERLAAGSIGSEDADALLDEALTTVKETVAFVPQSVYAPHILEARRRVPRDPDDVPTVALALAFGCGIWTNDYDFFGCGVATWVTETILQQITASDSGSARVT